jgi:hypothetical protein
LARSKKNTEALAAYRGALTRSKRWREDEHYDSTWERLRDTYALKFFDSTSSVDQIAVAISFANINVIGPSIAINHPKTTVLARRPEDADKATISEAVLDWLWKSGDTGDEFRRAVKDFLIFGHGWVKTGYRFEEREVEVPESKQAAEHAAMIDQANQAAEADPLSAHLLPTDDEIAAHVVQTEKVTVEDRPFAERVSPFDMFVDPDAVTVNTAGWMAQRIVRPLADIRADTDYNQSARMSVTSDVEAKYTDENRARRGSLRDSDRATVWEFYDLRRNLVCVFAQGGDEFLVEPRPIPYRIGHPFVMLRNYEVPDRFYPIGDLEAIEPLQQELNRARSQAMAARESYAQKYLARASAFDQDAREALEAREDRVVFVNEGNDPLTDMIIPLPIKQIPPELFSYSGQIEADINLVSGVSDYQRGAAPEVRRTATEAALIQDSSNARAADKLAIIEKAVARVGYNLLALARQYMDGEQVARVIGNSGRPLWVPFTSDDLDIDSDLVVEGGSTQPKNESWRQNQAMQLLQALGPMIGTVIDPQPLAKFVLSAYGVKNPESYLMAAPPAAGPPGAPQGPPGAPEPNPDPNGAPPDGAADAMGASPDASMDIPPELVDPNSPDGLPPEIRAQLQGQVGLPPQ